MDRKFVIGSVFRAIIYETRSRQNGQRLAGYARIRGVADVREFAVHFRSQPKSQDNLHRKSR